MVLDFILSAAPSSRNFTPPPVPSGSNIGFISFTTTTQDVITSPAPVWLDGGTATGLASAQQTGGSIWDYQEHEYEWVWWITDGPLLPWTAPTNLVPGWNQPNITYGRRAAFCFPEPGSYTINLRVIDRAGNYAEASSGVTVVDPDTVYTTTNTVCYSAEGNFTGAPAEAQQLTTLAAVQTAIEAAPSPLRVLLRRGETYTNFKLNMNINARIDYFGAYGSGEKPLIRPPEFDTSNMMYWDDNSPETRITITGLKILGWWNPETETGTAGGDSPFLWYLRDTETDIIMHDCDFENVYELFVGNEGTNNGVPNNVMLANVSVEGWRRYGIYASGNNTGDKRFAFIGVRSTMKPLALQGGDRNSRIHNGNGSWRITDANWLVMDCCDGFSTTGTSSNHAQPVLRWLTTGTPFVGAVCHIGRCVMESGYQIINFEGQNTSAEDNPVNAVMDRILLIGSAQSNQKMVSCHKGGTTWRNIFVTMPNVPNDDTGPNPNTIMDFDANNHQNGNAAEPIHVYNCTFVSLLDSTNDEGQPILDIGGTSSWSNFTVENNVFHIPSGTTPVTTRAPLDGSTSVGITPRFPGIRFGWEIYDIASVTIPDGGAHTMPYPAIQDRENNLSGTATNQAYWTANQATDRKHQVSVGRTQYYSENGDFTVTYGVSNITITNTSGVTWSGRFFVNLDRTSRLAADNPLQTGSSNPATIPTSRQQSGSSAINPGSGLFAIHDFNGDLRGASPDAGVWQGVS